MPNSGHRLGTRDVGWGQEMLRGMVHSRVATSISATRTPRAPFVGHPASSTTFQPSHNQQTRHPNDGTPTRRTRFAQALIAQINKKVRDVQKAPSHRLEILFDDGPAIDVSSCTVREPG
jgi:hypothetical protein